MSKFGYSELYEWTYNIDRSAQAGLFVQFDDMYFNKIKPCVDSSQIIGVSTFNYVESSDDPEYWHNKYLLDKYGNIYVEPKTISEGSLEYDDEEEFPYIKTKEQNVFLGKINPKYDQNKEYVKRSERKEWVNVTLLGKAIVIDNGLCTPGDYCTAYSGNNDKFYGSAVPAKDTDKRKYYVLERVSDTTVMILVK